jgi:beta-glucanase (GH16 family)
MLSLVVFAGALLCGGCGGMGHMTATPTPTPTPTAVAPAVTTAAAQNGAVIASLASTTSGATIYYTLDGSTPTTSSQVYEAPFLVASNLTVKAMAAASGSNNSSVTTQAFTTSIPSGTLVWSDEFNGTAGTTYGQPNPATWTYDTGTNCCGNNEQETYCAWGSTTAPCSTASPNAYVGSDGYLHIQALQPTAGAATYTSARLKSSGLFSFMYGRIEARMQLPESQGMWPAFWMLGNNIATVNWPASGELDIMEHIDGNNPPLYVGATPPGYDWVAGSVHGGTSGSNEGNGTQQYHPPGFSAAAWHTYGMIWTKGQIQYYIDDPTNIYATFNTSSLVYSNGSVAPWPFDVGPQFVILNLAVGGDWPGNVDSTTVLPGNMLVDYVRIYTP